MSDILLFVMNICLFVIQPYVLLAALMVVAVLHLKCVHVLLSGLVVTVLKV